MQINFYITENAINEMSTEDYEALERAQDGEARLYRLRPVMCHFMVDDDGKPIPYEEALKITKKFKLPEAMSFVQQFFKAVEEKAVPKANGSLSKSPIEAEQAGSLSQTG